MNVGIVGHEAAKFTELMEVSAKLCILNILMNAIHEHESVTVVSGGCHLGGIDIWAEEVADNLSIPGIIHLPQRLQWSGYKARNLKIARDSDELHVIAVEGYHRHYSGMRFDRCYHCYRRISSMQNTAPSHVKGGACWTAKQAIRLGKKATWHIIPMIEPAI